MNKRDNIVKWSIISIFVGLYGLVSAISTIHVIDFFKLSNPDWLAITLAIAFEIGAAACLGAIIILNKTSKALVWVLFILITLIQVIGNMYYTYSHVENFQQWSELFGLIEEEEIFQKRILSFISGAILPIVALGFIKSLVDYIRPEDSVQSLPPAVNDQITDSVTQSNIITEEEEDEKEDQPKEELIKAKEEWEGAFEKYAEDYIQDADSLIEYHNNEEEVKHNKQTERKLAMAIANDPELKEKLNEAIKKLNVEDKYNKNSDTTDINKERRVYGGM